jgi:hypothetical protein
VTFNDEAEEVALDNAWFGVAPLDDVLTAREDDDDLIVIALLPGDLAVYASAEWLAGETDGVSNEDLAVSFLSATLKAWLGCTTDAAACAEAISDDVPDVTEADLSDATPPVFDTSGWEEGSFRTDLFEQAFESLNPSTSTSTVTESTAEATP